MKRVLILVIGCSLDTWNKMAQTSIKTWDSFEIPNVETIYYFGNPIKENTDKFIYFPIDESYYTMGEKMMCAFDWALKNKEFEYIARVNSSCYVDKKRLIEYVQGLPNKNLFVGLKVEGEKPYYWGGGQYIISKDVIEKIVANRDRLSNKVMEDVALSNLIDELKIPFTQGKACSIDKVDLWWRLTGYSGESFEFYNFEDCKKSGQHFYRVKQDYNRDMDAFLMHELHRVLKELDKITIN